MTTPLERTTQLQALKEQEFDVLVIGGGIFGATAVWEAQQRGLKAAIVEATDFCHGSSANSYKVIHGGIRYLQHVDVARVWSSSRERSAFMRIAPHLCKPLPIMVPTYGLGTLGKPFLGIGCLAYDFLTAFRNRGITDESRKIPFTRFMSRNDALKEYPGLPEDGLTGACVFNDGRFYNPTRLVWSFISAAIQGGATACNYLKADGLLNNGKKVCGITATDTVSGETFEIRAKSVLNTAGPWAEDWLGQATNGAYKPSGVYSRDACFVINRELPSALTLALQGESADPDALLAREKRHLFVSPWRGKTLVGVWHIVTDMKPEDVTVSQQELEMYITEVNNAFPGINISLDEVTMWNAGLVPFGEEQRSDENLSYGKRSYLIDHEDEQGLENFVSLVGLRFTMARGETEKAVTMIQRKLRAPGGPINSDFIALPSAQFKDFETLLLDIRQRLPMLDDDTVQSLAHNYGSDYANIAQLIDSDAALAGVYENTTVTKAEIEYVCRNEMVHSLTDVVFRRTDFATTGDPGSSLDACAEQAAEILGWNEARTAEELAKVRARFPVIAV